MTVKSRIATLAVIGALSGLSASAFAAPVKYDVYSGGQRVADSRDTYTDGARAVDKRDVFLDGARVNDRRDAFSDGA
ncbi:MULTISPECIES: hypothetical protein [unclassified Cupriavidus]|uniref:hypothetical protein n=1 Tax=unclassified Cupriavidus TaxID=2640874 RepID=UPI0010F5D6BD|nr:MULTISPECIES: hypothetical protein [unclassified Cupriavidus]MWL87869.1 hypothetical protein [Cupriavidus sp. SW-Y-13]